MFDKLHSIVSKWQERANLARELYAMTDRDLADIGISVNDIPLVLNGQYARDDLNKAASRYRASQGIGQTSASRAGSRVA